MDARRGSPGPGGGDLTDCDWPRLKKRYNMVDAVENCQARRIISDEVRLVDLMV